MDLTEEDFDRVLAINLKSASSGRSVPPGS